MRRLPASPKVRSSIWPTGAPELRDEANSTCWPRWARTGSCARCVGCRRRQLHHPISRYCRIWSCQRITMRAGDVNLRRLHATLAAAADAGPRDFAELLLSPGIGARTVRSLAMVAEIVHGAPYRFADPARFSLAHGGKDRHPFPVPITVYDQTIRVLKTAVAKARLGREEELAALKRLDDQARRLEGRVTGPTFPQVLDQERLASHANGGRSVFGWEPPL